MRRSLTPLTYSVGCARKPRHAVAGERREHDQRGNRRAVAMRRVLAVVGEHGGTGKDRDREEREPPDADQRRGLRQHQRLGQRVAERVPGKSAEQVAAQPFGDGEGGGERQNARWPAHPDQPGAAPSPARYRRRAPPAGRRPRPATASRRSWRRPGRRSRPNKARPGNSRSRSTSRRRPRARRRSTRPAAEPSTSQTSTGKVRNSTGQALIGASASAEAAPATKAMMARRQPEASTIEWARRVMCVTGGAGLRDWRLRRGRLFAQPPRQPAAPAAWCRPAPRPVRRACGARAGARRAA